MRTILTILLSCFITTATMGQVDIEVKALAPTMTPNYKISNTVKIIVKNNSEEPKILFLGFNQETTGYKFRGCTFPHPLGLMGELGSTMDYKDDLLPLTFFADWFKVIKPNEQFVMYFQRDSEIDADGLAKLIRIIEFQPYPYIDKLDWKEDEIVIHLPSDGERKTMWWD